VLLSGSMEVIIPSSRAFVPRWLLIAFYGAMTVLAGIANTVTFFEMGQKMGPYPMFLLYFTTMIYVTLYGLTGALTVRARMWKGEVSGSFYSNFVLPEQQRRLVTLGFWLIVNGLFSQFANPYVDGNLQSVLYQVCARVPACRHGCARVCGYAWVRLVLARPRALFALAAASSCCSFFFSGNVNILPVVVGLAEAILSYLPIHLVGGLQCGGAVEWRDLGGIGGHCDEC